MGSWESFKVGGVGVVYVDVGWVVGVVGVWCGVLWVVRMKFILFGGKGERYKFGSLMNEVLFFGRILDCFWGLDYICCGVFDGDELFVGLVD